MSLARRLTAMLPLLVATATAAYAQNAGTPARAPIEVGISLGKLAPRIYGDFSGYDISEPTADLRVSVPVSPRWAVEGVVMVGRRDAGFHERTEGLYFVQLKQRLYSAERRRLRPFLTYGLAGYYAHVYQPASDIAQPGGIIIHRPATTFRELDPPYATAVGAGVDYRASRWLALRADTQMVSILYLPLLVRSSIGVSIPIGGGYSTN